MDDFVNGIELGVDQQRLASFTQCLDEISSLLSSRSIDPANVSEMMSVGMEHFQRLEAVTLAIGLDLNETYDRFIARRLSVVLTKLPDSALDIDSLSSAISDLHDQIIENTELLECLPGSEVSEDMLVAVKMSLLPGSVKFAALLRAMGLPRIDHSDWLAWHQHTAVALAQDIAFNWDKSATFRDREELFTQSLEHCSELVIGAWIDATAETAKASGAKPTVIIANSLWNHLDNLSETLAENGLGYESHETYTLHWLREKIGAFLISLVEQLPWNGSTNEINADLKSLLNHRYLRQIEPIAVEAWLSVCDAAIEHFESLAPDEQDSWLASEEGSRPVPVEKFFAELNKRMTDAGDLSSCETPSEDTAKVYAQQRLTLLWGLSDAVATVREAH